MKPLLLFVLLVVPFSLAAQNRTNVWELGYTDTIIPEYPNCEMRYANGAMDTNSIYRVMAFFSTNASICDTSGDLLFYSNGLIVGNRDYDTLQNSKDFNPGWASDYYEPDGMGICQGVLIIPYPENPNLYYIFSVSAEILPTDIQPIHLSYSIIDMNLDAGLGGILNSQKNIYVIEDTLTMGGLTAVKHANGRDWWVISRHYFSNEYYKLLVTPNGIEGPFIQNIGSIIPNDVFVQATFSPDGSKFCFSTFNGIGQADYMNFDRCTGEFYDPITIYSPDSIPLRGNAFSPNSRFLYTNSLFNLYQYDTWDSNMAANVIHIASWDSFYQYDLPVWFYMNQLAPDGKIYISPFSGLSYLSVINTPDSIGLSCDFAPHSYVLPAWTFNIPSFPNYDLGVLDGSPCDTIVNIPTGLQPPNSSSFRISPNPATARLNIVYETSADGLFELFDINGKRVAATSLYHYFKNRLIDVSNLPAGVYLATVTENGKQVWREKVVILH